MTTVHLYIQVKFYVPEMKRLLYGHRAKRGVADGSEVERIALVEVCRGQGGIQGAVLVIGY